MTWTNRNNIPIPIAEAIKARPYSRGESDISVTSLISPPRIFQMQERLGDALERDVTDHLAALDGSAMHACLEWAGVSLDSEDWVLEKRWYAELEGWTLSGQSDVIRKSKRLLQDYKRCSKWVGIYGAKEEWTQQLNSLMWLAWKNGVETDTLEIVAWYKDWSKTGKERDPSKFPDHEIEVIPISTWTLEQTEAWLIQRIKTHQAASLLPTASLPMCTEEERWQKADGYAIMIGDASRAKKVCHTRQEALSYIASDLSPDQVAKAKIEPRTSAPKRCQHWCPVRFQCDYGKRWAKV